MPDYLRASISNGNAREQALIRRWWHERHRARGCIVWEYYLNPCYADAVWFPHEPETGVERSGIQSSRRFPIEKKKIVLCEAKIQLNPALLGQAAFYTWLARKAGATLERTVVWAERAVHPSLVDFGEELGLTVLVKALVP